MFGSVVTLHGSKSKEAFCKWRIEKSLSEEIVQSIQYCILRFITATKKSGHIDGLHIWYQNEVAYARAYGPTCLVN